jgi:hypothetical protein
MIGGKQHAIQMVMMLWRFGRSLVQNGRISSWMFAALAQQQMALPNSHNQVVITTYPLVNLFVTRHKRRNVTRLTVRC